MPASINFHIQSVTPDSLNRLVACTADDSKIIAICGETKLDNEEGSWWTMVQVSVPSWYALLDGCSYSLEGL